MWIAQMQIYRDRNTLNWLANREIVYTTYVFVFAIYKWLFSRMSHLQSQDKTDRENLFDSIRFEILNWNVDQHHKYIPCQRFKSYNLCKFFTLTLLLTWYTLFLLWNERRKKRFALWLLSECLCECARFMIPRIPFRKSNAKPITMLLYSYLLYCLSTHQNKWI